MHFKHTKILVPLLTFIFALFFVDSTRAQKIPLDTAVHAGTLANGFTYYIRQNNEPKNRVFLYLVNKVGSVLEDDDQQGLAHFMEHMNFNGTTHFPKNELVSYLQKSGVRFGADLNAYTSFDETVFQLPIPADDPTILKNGFQIMRDWAQDATLDSIEIDKERGVVLEEQRLGRGAGERMRRIYFPVILNRSRYAERLPIGTVDIIKYSPYSAIRRFHSDWYRPDLQALVVVGDIDPVKTEILIRQLFSDLRKPINEKFRTEYKVGLTGENHFLSITDPEMPQIVMQIIVKHKEELLITEPDYILSMRRQLFNMMVAQRFAELSQTQNLPFIEAGANIDGFLGGLDAFTFEIALKKDKMDAGFLSAWEAIEKIKRFGFTASELERAKQNYLSNIESSFKEKDKTNSESFVGEYQRNFLHQEASPGISWEYNFVKNNIGSITLDQINAITKEYIRDDNRDILLMAPEKDKSSLPDSSTVAGWMNMISNKNLTAYVDEVNHLPLISTVPTAGTITNTKTIKEVGVTELTLGNGIKIICKPTNFKNDEIRFAAFSPGGSSLYPDLEFQNAKNAALIAGFGLGNFDPAQLNKQLTGKRVQVGPYIDERNEGLQGFSSPKDLETAMQLIWLYFTSPRKDSAIFNNIVNNAREMIANRYSDPKNVFTDTVNYILGNYNYRRTPPSIEKLNQLNLEKLYSIYKDRFSDAGGFTFVFVGSFNIDSLRPLLEKWLGSLPSLSRHETARDLGIHIPAGQLTKKVYKGSEDKATVRMVFSGDYTFTAENNLELAALKEVLAIKITQHLREDESEVYSPSVQVVYNKYPQNRYAFTVSFGCAPANADHLMNGVMKELAIVRQNGPTQEDLDKFKAEYRRVHELQQTQNDYWLTTLLNTYQNNEQPSEISNNEKLIYKLTPASLQKAAKKYLTENNVLKFELLPEQK